MSGLVRLARFDAWLERRSGLRFVDRLWAAARRAGFVLWLTRASLLIMLITAGAFFTPQVSDAMVQLSESGAALGQRTFAATLIGCAAWAGFFAAEASWAFAISYSARFVLMFDFGMLRHFGVDTLVQGRAEQVVRPGAAVPPAAPVSAEAQLARKRMQWHVIWWPRIYALAGPLLVALAQYRSAEGGDLELKLMSAGSVAVALGMFAFMIYRRRILAFLGRFSPATVSGTPPMQPIFVRSAVRNRDVDRKVVRSRVVPLDPAEIRTLAIAAFAFSALAIGFGFLASFLPHLLTQITSSPALVFLLTAAWLPGLVLLVLVSHWRAFPVFAAGLVLATIANFTFRDHHQVRLQPKAESDVGRVEFAAAAETWKEANAGERPIIVATAGGGLRAAFWTATVLGALEDCTNQFGKRTFAISGVSGGSVGAAAYSALLSSGRSPLHCNHDSWTYFDTPLSGQTDGQLNGFRQCGQAILSHNFLSAPLVALAFKDIPLDLSRLNSPLSSFMEVTDRAAASTDALQSAWRQHMTNAATGETVPGFETGFLANTRAEKADWRPALIFNSTSTVSGARLAISSLELPDSGPLVDDFPGDLHDMLPSTHDVSLAEAAFLSARFPVISPAASVVTGRTENTEASIAIRNERRARINKPPLKIEEGARFRERIVDGGYFENFGATSAEDILLALRGHGLRPIVVQISSDPGVEAPQGQRGLAPGLDGVLAPLSAVIQTRNARGVQATHALMRTARSGGPAGTNYFHIRLGKTEGQRSAPLGWMLSKRSQERITDQLCDVSNAREMDRLIELLGGAPTFVRHCKSWDQSGGSVLYYAPAGVLAALNSCLDARQKLP